MVRDLGWLDPRSAVAVNRGINGIAPPDARPCAPQVGATNGIEIACGVEYTKVFAAVQHFVLNHV